MTPADREPIVSIRGLCYARDDRLILDDIDLDVRAGCITAVMGPSGCGKTTLLKLIGGQLQPDAGTVNVLGRQVHSLGRDALFTLRKRIGMMFQNGALLTDLDVFENVAFPLREHAGLPESLLRDLVLMKLEAVGLRGAARMLPTQLSGGMARRVALARAIALDPALVMYDEPFTGQDPISTGVLARLLRELNDALGLTGIVVSHDIEETCAIADYVYLLSGGRVIAQGDTDSLRSTVDVLPRQFLDGSPDGPVPFHFPAGSYRDALLEDSGY